MTNQEINERIAEITGFHDKVGLKKRGYWYRPNARGYTSREDEAGRYTNEEAKKHEYLIGEEPVTIHNFTTPNYSESLDACLAFEKEYTFGEQEKVFDGMVNRLGVIDATFATPLQRCEAFLRLKGQWE